MLFIQPYEMKVRIASSISSGSVPLKTDDNDIDTSSIIMGSEEGVKEGVLKLKFNNLTSVHDLISVVATDAYSPRSTIGDCIRNVEFIPFSGLNAVQHPQRDTPPGILRQILSEVAFFTTS